jgi:hypothetical protein
MLLVGKFSTLAYLAHDGNDRLIVH